MRLLMISNLAVLLVSTLPGATLTQSERDKAMSHLHASRKMLADSVSGLSAAQLSWKASPDKWSVADVAEHLAVSEEFILGMAKKTLAAPASEQKSEVKDEEWYQRIVSRERKAQAPEPLKPTNRFASAKEAVDHFSKERLKTIAFVEKSTDDMRSRTMKHPAGVVVDSYQMILMIAAHTERHVDQIREIKADPAFPKK